MLACTVIVTYLLLSMPTFEVVISLVTLYVCKLSVYVVEIVLGFMAPQAENFV